MPRPNEPALAGDVGDVPTIDARPTPERRQVSVPASPPTLTRTGLNLDTTASLTFGR